MNYEKSDRNLLKCSRCGKYKVDTTEEFEVNYKADGSKEWLCETCNKYKSLFKGKMFGTDLMLIIAPVKDSDDCRVYSKDMYI